MDLGVKPGQCVLKARFDLLEKQRESDLERSKSIIKRLWKRIPQDIIVNN